MAAWNLRHSWAKRAQPAQAERQILRNRGPVTPATADHSKHGILIDSLTWRPTTSQHYNLSDCGHCVVMEGLFRSHQCLVHNKIAITEQMWPDKKQANSDWKHPFSAVCSNLSGHNHAKPASRFFRDYRSHATGFCPARPCRFGGFRQSTCRAYSIGFIGSFSFLLHLISVLVPPTFNISPRQMLVRKFQATKSPPQQKPLIIEFRVPAWFWPVHTLQWSNWPKDTG